MRFRIKEYIDRHGTNHFRTWLSSLPLATKARAQVRLLRVEEGNLGDWKSVGKGVFELRLHFESGIRIYFGKEGKNLILLITGGSKSTQRKDIQKAILLWEEYKTGDRNGTQK